MEDSDTDSEDSNDTEERAVQGGKVNKRKVIGRENRGASRQESSNVA